jgi:hypothetical protein
VSGPIPQWYDAMRRVRSRFGNHRLSRALSPVRNRSSQAQVVDVKQIFPVIMALIPLAAVIGACMTCP